MNRYKILVFGMLFSAFGALAQNYGGRNYNGQNRNGLNRDIGRDYTRQEKTSPEEIEKNKAEQLEKVIAKLKVAITLDELQVIAIRNEIASNMKNVDIVLKKGTTDDEKGKEIKALMEKTEVVINSYLSKDQKEKYKAFVADSKKGKKDKKIKKETTEPTETNE